MCLGHSNWNICSPLSPFFPKRFSTFSLSYWEANSYYPRELIWRKGISSNFRVRHVKVRLKVVRGRRPGRPHRRRHRGSSREASLGGVHSGGQVTQPGSALPSLCRSFRFACRCATRRAAWTARGRARCAEAASSAAGGSSPPRTASSRNTPGSGSQKRTSS